jgi:ribosomal-protein-alanine N-acetyltransferase
MASNIDKEVVALEPMLASDIQALVEIETQCHYSPWNEKQFQSSIESSHHCFVLKDEQAICAYIVLSTAADEAELLNITVAPDFQKLGLGTQVLLTAIDYLDNSINTLFLEVRESNQAAIALYQSLDFNEVGLRPNYYPAKSGREDAIIMAKLLSYD